MLAYLFVHLLDLRSPSVPVGRLTHPRRASQQIFGEELN